MVEDPEEAKDSVQTYLTSSPRPSTEPPCSPVPQISGQLLSVTVATEIVTFKENYQTTSNYSQ